MSLAASAWFMKSNGAAGEPSRERSSVPPDGFGHSRWMTCRREKDKALYPTTVGLLGPAAVMSGAQSFPPLVEKFWFPRGRPGNRRSVCEQQGRGLPRRRWRAHKNADKDRKRRSGNGHVSSPSLWRRVRSRTGDVVAGMGQLCKTSSFCQEQRSREVRGRRPSEKRRHSARAAGRPNRRPADQCRGRPHVRSDHRRHTPRTSVRSVSPFTIFAMPSWRRVRIPSAMAAWRMDWMDWRVTIMCLSSSVATRSS